MSNIAIVDPECGYPLPANSNSVVKNVTTIRAYELPHTDLSPFDSLLISGGIDQEHLYRNRNVIESFLADGKTVVWCGHLFREWLPGCGVFEPRTIREWRDYTVCVGTPHPIFEGVNPDELTRRKGVAGFFARGHHPPPPQAEILLTFPDGSPIVYIDRTTTAGVILAHPGTDLLGWGDTDNSAARIAPQLVTWLNDEATSTRVRSEQR